MNGKQVKKLKRLHNKFVVQQYRSFAEDVLKPKPKWCPLFLWRILLNLVIKIKYE